MSELLKLRLTPWFEALITESSIITFLLCQGTLESCFSGFLPQMRLLTSFGRIKFLAVAWHPTHEETETKTKTRKIVLSNGIKAGIKARVALYWVVRRNLL